MTLPRAAPLVLAGLLALAASGCLRQAADEASVPAMTCDGPLRPQQVPASAPTAGGDGPRAVHAFVADAEGTPLAGQPFTAWWLAGDAVHVAHLRTGDDGYATVGVPSGVAVTLLSGATAWSHDAAVAAGSDPIDLAMVGPAVQGARDGVWSSPATIGTPEPAWQDATFPWADAAHLARLESLRLTLTWENGAGGGADFGIAVGAPDGAFRYWNQQPQTNPGDASEELIVDRAVLEQEGWTSAATLAGGPSVSTGAFATTGIAYTLSWDVRFLQDPDVGDLCAAVGDLPVVVTGRTQLPSGTGTP